MKFKRLRICIMLTITMLLTIISCGTTLFQDITANSELSGYVNGVVGAGLMLGKPDSYFHPVMLSLIHLVNISINSD